MRRNSQILLSIALVFACAYASASATESQQLSPDSGAACPDNTATSNDRGELGDADPLNSTPAPVRRTEKAKAAPTPRSSTRAATPRWHSFLPGMFR